MGSWMLLCWLRLCLRMLRLLRGCSRRGSTALWRSLWLLPLLMRSWLLMLRLARGGC